MLKTSWCRCTKGTDWFTEFIESCYSKMHPESSTLFPAKLLASLVLVLMYWKWRYILLISLCSSFTEVLEQKRDLHLVHISLWLTDIITYSNGFHQRIARQGLCKQGPPHNNRECCVFLLRGDVWCMVYGGHVTCVSCDACPLLGYKVTEFVRFREETVLGRR
jgi:hypothetical protein